jgi:hypothetical protein
MKARESQRNEARFKFEKHELNKMRSIYSIKSNDRGLLSTARRFNGIFNPSKKTFSYNQKIPLL